MSDLNPFLNIGVGAGTFLAGFRLAWPGLKELLHRNGNGANGTRSYLEGKDIGAITARLDTIAGNTADTARSNAQILDGLGMAREALEKHEDAAVARANALKVEVIEARKLVVKEVVQELAPRTRRKR